MRVLLPLQLGRGLNSREHWAVKAARVKSEREAVAWAFKDRTAKAQLAEDRGHNPENRWVVVITRASARKLDDDNLSGSCKGVRDQVAEQLGIDDGDERLRFVYRWEKQTVGPTVLIEVLPLGQWLQEESDRLLRERAISVVNP